MGPLLAPHLFSVPGDHRHTAVARWQPPKKLHQLTVDANSFKDSSENGPPTHVWYFPTASSCVISRQQGLAGIDAHDARGHSGRVLKGLAHQSGMRGGQEAPRLMVCQESVSVQQGCLEHVPTGSDSG